jgi:hypothetical protein
MQVDEPEQRETPPFLVPGLGKFVGCALSVVAVVVVVVGGYH